MITNIRIVEDIYQIMEVIEENKVEEIAMQYCKRHIYYMVEVLRSRSVSLHDYFEPDDAEKICNVLEDVE